MSEINFKDQLDFCKDHCPNQSEFRTDIKYIKEELAEMKATMAGLDDSFKAATYWIIGILVAVVGTFGYFAIAKVMG